MLPLSLLGPSHQSATIEEGITYSKGATITLHERQETASQVVAMLDDIADAIWILSDEKMPRQDKKRARALVRELQGIVRRLPAGAAEGIASEIASRFMGG